MATKTQDTAKADEKQAEAQETTPRVRRVLDWEYPSRDERGYCVAIEVKAGSGAYAFGKIKDAAPASGVAFEEELAKVISKAEGRKISREQLPEYLDGRKLVVLHNHFLNFAMAAEAGEGEQASS